MKHTQLVSGGYMFIVSALCCTILFSRSALAGQDSVALFEGFLPHQIVEMSEEEINSSVPIKFIGVASLAASEEGDLILQSSLNTLMYNGLADYEGARRAFQADLGEDATGELTVGQISTLLYRASRANMIDVSFFPFDFGGTMSDSWAFVQGTLKMIDEPIADPINHVDIECSRDAGTCRYRMITLTVPDENSWVQSYTVAETVDETYRITGWENRQIDAGASQ